MNRDTILNGLIIILVLILAIVLAFNYTNPSDKYIPETGDTVNNRSGHVIDMKVNKSNDKSNISFEPMNMSLATTGDMKLISLIKESDNFLKGDLQLVLRAARNNDHKSIGIYGITMREDSQKYLDRLNNINISSSFKILFEEYRYALDNYSKAGRYMDMGSKNPGDLRVAINYLDTGVEHMRNVYNIIGLKDGKT